MRVNFTATSTSVPDARLAVNIAHARSLGLPYVDDRAGGMLNVIGRGPSVSGHIETLRSGPENWACGTAWAWCRDNGIDAVFVAADPSPVMARYVSGVKRAIVAEQCDPALFEALKGAEIELAHMDRCSYGSTTAVMAAVLGVTKDSEARLYGCDGCYAETTHVDEDQPQPNEIRLRCNGREFRTNPQMIMQSEELSGLIRLSDRFVDCSGGLLGAMVVSPDWELLDWPNAPENVRKLMT